MKATLDDAAFNEHDECSNLFARARGGDQAAATVLYRLTVPSLRSWLASRVQASLAEDIAHDAMTAAFSRSERFRPQAAFQPWVRTIAWNLALNSHRSEERRRRRETEYAEHERSHHEAPAQDQNANGPLLAELAQQIGELPLPHRDLLHCRFGLGQTADEIAAHTRRSRVAVAVSLHRICRRLRSRIEQAWPHRECSHADETGVSACGSSFTSIYIGQNPDLYLPQQSTLNRTTQQP